MVLLLDADALIKLNRIGLLREVARAYECVTTQQVYHEVVTQGRQRQRLDADPIAGIIEASILLLGIVDIPESLPGLGEGEMSLLASVEIVPEVIVLSDDRQFLSTLDRRRTPYLTTAQLVPQMALDRHVTVQDALEFLDKLRPMVQRIDYEKALMALALVKEQRNGADEQGDTS